MCKVMRATIPEDTRARILDAAWALVGEAGPGALDMQGVARRAGVSRQTVHLAFGDRARLLAAMARRRDAESPHARRMQALADSTGADAGTLIAYLCAWMMHLPGLMPVAVLLQAAAATDEAAAAAVEDRTIGGLWRGYRAITGRLADAGGLAPGLDADGAADLCWSLTHIDAWRQLVLERGWSADRFRESAERLVRLAVLRG